MSDEKPIEPEILEIARLISSLVDKRLNEREAVKPDEDEELTVREAASLKRVSDRTVRTWIAKKKVTPIRTPGGGIRLLRSEIDKAA